MPPPTAHLRYDVVVLDVGGTLLGLHHPAPFRQFLAEAGLPASQADARRLHRRLVGIIVARRDSAGGLGAGGDELSRWWHGIFSQTWPGRPDLADRMLAWFNEGRLNRLYDDALPALAALRDLGLPLGIVSNFGAHLRPVLDRFGLASFFKFVVISAEVGLAKPDPRIFDLAVAESGAPRRRILYVGDHVGDDVEGAWGAGLDAVLVDRGARHLQARCPRIGNLLELARYVRPPTGPAPAIVLDMDGIVLDSMPHHLRSWQQALAPLGVELSAADLYPLEGVPTEQTAQKLTERLLGAPCSEEEAVRLAKAKRDAFARSFEPTLVLGIGPLLYDLRGRGYHLALVTGSARRVVDESLAPTGLTDLFEAIIPGDEVSRGKPHPESYARAAAALDLPPEACLAVENAVLGIRSARAAGMGCVALETTLAADQLLAAGAQRAFPGAPALRDWLLAHWRGA
jgi:HAD superfamily hydrolase (TIGR01509 family)/HAD superfamily hydrolase (TIGR01549 family)